MDIDKFADQQTETVDDAEQFYGERLMGYSRDEWPARIDRAALDVIYGVAIGSSDEIDDFGGTIGKTNFGEATGEHYEKGLTELADSQSDLPQLLNQYGRNHGSESVGDLAFRLNELRFELEQHFSSEDDISNLNRALELLIDKIATASLEANTSRQDFQRPESVTEAMIQLFSDPSTAEYAGVLTETIKSIARTESVLDRLDAPYMTTPLWEHQRDALTNWVDHDCKGYVDMATATGKTVLGLAAVALLYGQLHPDDASTIVSNDEDEIPARTQEDPARVLVVAGQELILEQWQSELDEHLNIPRERTSPTENTMEFTWGSIEFRTAPDLLQMETLSGYDLVILDEAHQYRRGGRTRGWQDVFEELAQESVAMLAMSGSIDTSWEGDSQVRRVLEDQLYECQRFSVDEAREAGVIADFEWDVFYTHSADSESQDGVVESTASIREIYDAENHKIRVEDLDGDVPSSVPSEFETLTDLRSFSQSKEGTSAREASSAFDDLATDAFTRRPKRWQLFPPVETLVTLVDRHAPEQQCVVLVQSYKQAEQVGAALEQHFGDDLVRILDSDTSDQFSEIATFKEQDYGIIVGPANVLGTGVDLPNAEVAINLSKGGVNASLIQRIGRVLRNPNGDKEATFYQIVTIPSDPQGLLPGEDGRRLLRRASEFRALGARLRQLPGYDIADESTAETLATLERHGADAVTADDRAIEEIVEDEVAQAFLQTLRQTIVNKTESEANSPTLSTFNGGAIDRQARPVAEAVEHHVSEDPQTEQSTHSQPTRQSEGTDQLSTAVEKYTGSPAGMGRSLRESVDAGEIPQVIENELNDEVLDDRDRVLTRLDTLLPTFETSRHTDESESQPTSADSTQHSTDTTDEDTDEADETEQTPSMKGVTTDNDSTAVELSPALAVLLELIVSADDRSGSSRQELIDDALEGFLSSTIGSELDPERFETTDKMTVNLECDPVLTRVLERFTQNTDGTESIEEVAIEALTDHIGISEVETTVEVEGLARYQIVIDALVANDEYPCESTDGVVQAALERHLVESSNH